MIFCLLFILGVPTCLVILANVIFDYFYRDTHNSYYDDDDDHRGSSWGF